MFRYLLLCLCPISICSQSTLLWKISGNGLQQPSFLYGTFHHVCTHHFKPTPTTLKALQVVDEIYFEVHLDSLSYLPEIDFKNEELRLKNQQKILNRLLNEEQIDTIKRFTLKNGIQTWGKQVQEDFLVQIFSFARAKEFSCDFSEIISYEKELFKISKKKMHFGIESPKVHATYMQYLLLDLAELVHVVLAIVEHPTALAKNFKQDEAAFLRGDIHQLVKDQYGNFMMSKTQLAEFNRYLITYRNLNWIPKLIQKIHQKSLFIAVGASHLAGNTGLIPLLKKQGFTVEPCFKL